MTLTDQTRQIVGFVWARMLGIDDGTFDEQPAVAPLVVVDESSSAVRIVSLFGHTIISGPPAACDVLAAAQTAQLASDRRLLELLLPQHPGARTAGTARLLYCEEPSVPAALDDDLPISFDPADASTLSAQCPADDVAASGVGAAEWTATMMHVPGDNDGRPGEPHGSDPSSAPSSSAAPGAPGPVPVAAAGREIWHHALAHLGVLTRPDTRRTGLGTRIAAIAAEEAFVEGLVPQWRVPEGSVAAARIAERIGFSQAGSQTTVLLS